MARITIKDLPREKKISSEEMKKVFGGSISGYQSNPSSGYYLGSDPYSIDDPSQLIPPHLAELFGVKKK